MTVLKKVLTNRNFILVLALALGLSLGNIGDWIRYLTIPALAVVMIVSFVQVDVKRLKPFSRVLKPALVSLFLNYAVYGSIVVFLAKLFIKDGQLFTGFLILALSPAGVAVAPFTDIMKGDMKFSLIGVVTTYIAALVILPVGGIIFIGQSFLRPLDTILVFLQLIVIPLILSQLFIKIGIDKRIKRIRGPIVNWGLFVVIFTVVALNRDVFFEDLKTVGIISAIAIVSLFVYGIILELILRKTSIGRKRSWSIILIATIKNTGFGAATALALVGDKASVPSAVTSIFLVLYLILLGIRSKRLS